MCLNISGRTITTIVISEYKDNINEREIPSLLGYFSQRVKTILEVYLKGTILITPGICILKEKIV